MKSALERMLDTEMDVHLGRKAIPALAAEEPPNGGPAGPNRRNGHSRKTVQGELGELTLETPPRSQRHVRAAIDRQASTPPQRFG
jgi:transposase-like protein